MKGSSPHPWERALQDHGEQPRARKSAKSSLLGPKGAWPAGSGSAASRLGIGSGLEGFFLYVVQ